MCCTARLSGCFRHRFRGHLRDAGLLADAVERPAPLADTASLVRALLVAGLYPFFCRCFFFFRLCRSFLFLPTCPPTGRRVARKVATADRGAAAARLHCADRSKWYCHPGSVNFAALGGRFSPAFFSSSPRSPADAGASFGDKAPATTYVLYHGRLRTTKPWLLDTSIVDPAALLLFGGRFSPRVSLFFPSNLPPRV